MWSLIGVCASVARSVFLWAYSDRFMRMEMRVEQPQIKDSTGKMGGRGVSMLE